MLRDQNLPLGAGVQRHGGDTVSYGVDGSVRCFSPGDPSALVHREQVDTGVVELAEGNGTALAISKTVAAVPERWILCPEAGVDGARPGDPLDVWPITPRGL
jgi:hypothetical protein